MRRELLLILAADTVIRKYNALQFPTYHYFGLRLSSKNCSTTVVNLLFRTIFRRLKSPCPLLLFYFFSLSSFRSTEQSAGTYGCDRSATVLGSST